MAKYQILLFESVLEDIKLYKHNIENKKIKPGAYMQKQIDSHAIEDVNTEKFIELLLRTKKTKIYATKEVKGDGSDWNQTEFKILGDISLSMNVEIYDNGVWKVTDKKFQVHNPPFNGNLIFTPGPLLRCAKGRVVPDLEEVVRNGALDKDKYEALIERRIVPAFVFANLDAGKQGKRALITLTGIGCGVFAGKFKGKMGEHLNAALISILEKYGEKLLNVSCVRSDPYSECKNSERKIHNLSYRVRLNRGPLCKPQLSKIQDFEECKDEFNNCVLYKIVAWDHFSFPGNNYFLGKRHTDDGVSAAATNSMEVITGVKGTYKNGFYLTPGGNKIWQTVAESQNSYLTISDNIYVTNVDGTCSKLLEQDSMEIGDELTEHPPKKRKT